MDVNKLELASQATKLACTGKAYLATTQNLSYIKKLHSHPKKAFTILGSGDSVFQLIYLGATDITAVDVNTHQFSIFDLRRAAIEALDYNDFYQFLLNSQGEHFLSPHILEKVLPYFKTDNATVATHWQNLINTIYPLNDSTYMILFRGGIDFYDHRVVRESLGYLANERAYQQLKENLRIAKIATHYEDAIYFLTQNGMNYDWIDISNILIYYYQATQGIATDIFQDNLRHLAETWFYSTNSNTLVLDYMFGVKGNEIRTGLSKVRHANTNPERAVFIIYDKIYSALSSIFHGIKIKQITASTDAMPTKGLQDSVLYVTK